MDTEGWLKILIFYTNSFEVQVGLLEHLFGQKVFHFQINSQLSFTL